MSGIPCGEPLPIRLNSPDINGDLVVNLGDFSGDVVVLTMVGALVIPIVLILLAGELGRRATAGEAADQPS